jgi:hypothetical protein
VEVPALIQLTASGEDRLDTRIDAISAGLRAIRIVDASRRWRSKTPLTNIDITTIRSTADDLRNEIRVLRNQTAPDVIDESAFAFASLALKALPSPGATSADAAFATRQLEGLVSDLEFMLSSANPDIIVAKRIEAVFLRASDLVQSKFGRTGETLEQDEDMKSKFETNAIAYP